jgi:predicted metalloprotease with PDZ domain
MEQEVSGSFRRGKFFPLIAILFLLLTSAEAGYAGAALSPITLSVDASEAPRKILHAHLVVPATSGPLTLVYPKWLPGEHGPTGPVTDLAGLRLTAMGRSLPWRRDLVDMYAFNCEVPPGAKTVEVDLDFLLPTSTEGFTSSASTSAQLAVINWNQVLLYPQGDTSDSLTYQVSLRLPAGWKFGTALAVAGESREAINFKPVSLTALVDSPLVAGAFFRRIDLSPGASPAHYIDMVSDSPAALAISPELIADYKQLVAETGALFGARHYTQYHFLYTLSDHVTSFGLEHHESSDNRVPERTLLDDAQHMVNADLLPHEFVHSWNGKYRRPADLTTTDFQQPMRTDLLWVYEGLTQYLGDVLSARTGLLTADDSREKLAWVAASLDYRAGRTWRPLVDTAVAAQLLYSAPPAWTSWRRSVDFYYEGVLIWLEADVIIRQRTQGRSSLNDFCRRFHGGESGVPAVKTYTLDDVVNALNEVAPYDWRDFFDTRVYKVTPRAPLGGIEGSGWRLVYTDVPNVYIQAQEQTEENVNLNYSLGLTLDSEGNVTDVIPNQPADKAGISPGMKLVAVGGRRWSPDILRQAVRTTKTAAEGLELLLENAEFYKTYRLSYRGGERYPHLERVSARPDLLDGILKPLAPVKRR